jgi:hypothetical protein
MIPQHQFLGVGMEVRLLVYPTLHWAQAPTLRSAQTPTQALGSGSSDA